MAIGRDVAIGPVALLRRLLARRRARGARARARPVEADLRKERRAGNLRLRVRLLDAGDRRGYVEIVEQRLLDQRRQLLRAERIGPAVGYRRRVGRLSVAKRVGDGDFEGRLVPGQVAARKAARRNEGGKDASGAAESWINVTRQIDIPTNAHTTGHAAPRQAQTMPEA